MAKKKDDEFMSGVSSDNIKLDDNFFGELMKDTDFNMASTGCLMHSRMKVRTPILALNCIYGGGLPLGILAEISGSPGSGKSTLLYQCMGNYQKDYPEGVSVIYDMESSMDNDRLIELGVDPARVLRLPSQTLESAFGNMFKMFNKLKLAKEKVPNISTFQIYDSLAAGGTNKQGEHADNGESVLGGAMMEAPRIIKNNLANVLPYMEDLPIFLGLLNQVFVHPGMYVAKIESGGGCGLKHLCHAHISFSGDPKDEYDKNFLVGTASNIILKKSKLSPKFVDIPCYIDVTKGGKIDEVESFFRYITSEGVQFISTGSYYKFTDYIKTTMYEKFPQLSNHEDLTMILNKSYRKDEMKDMLRDNKDLLNFLQVALIEFIDDIYTGQRIINTEYRDKLMTDSKYFSTDVQSVSDKLNNLASDLINKEEAE